MLHLPPHASGRRNTRRARLFLDLPVLLLLCLLLLDPLPLLLPLQLVRATDSESIEVGELIFEGLVGWKPGTTDVEPRLATQADEKPPCPVLFAVGASKTQVGGQLSELCAVGLSKLGRFSAASSTSRGLDRRFPRSEKSRSILARIKERTTRSVDHELRVCLYSPRISR